MGDADKWQQADVQKEKKNKKEKNTDSNDNNNNKVGDCKGFREGFTVLNWAFLFEQVLILLLFLLPS